MEYKGDLSYFYIVEAFIQSIDVDIQRPIDNGK